MAPPSKTLKIQPKIPTLAWSVLEVVQASLHILKRCLLYLNEKLLIAT